MSNKEAAKNIIRDLDAEIAPIKESLDKIHATRLAAYDFDDKNYYAGIEARYEYSIELLNKAKTIVLKHLGSA